MRRNVSLLEGFPRQKPGARSGLREKQYSKHKSESKTEASKYKTNQSDKKNQFSSVLDSKPSQPSASTPVVDEMHKEEQQAAGDPPSLGVTSEEGADPQLSSDMSAFIHIEPVIQLLAFFTLSLHQDVMLQQIPQLKLILEYLLLMILYLNNKV
ncbi:hypothetical protein Tco_0239194 [Tanacetum coccineum]